MSALAPERKIAAGVCSKCGKSITHPGPDGECVRCLVSFGFLSEDVEPQQGRESKAVRLGPLRYAHFKVEVNADGYPDILGSGAMAVTYLARDTVLNSTVALKVISRKLAEDPTARARFLREARAAAQIHHPNVARVIHYGEQDGECFYAMELVHGETLEERVQRDGPLPLSVALEVVEQTARGLAAGEACRVIHRDLKPSNLMIESDATGHMLVKIIDYGVAKVMVADAALATQPGFIGTPAFASPEQFNELGQLHVDTRSDIYSLGVVFWYLLTGQTPFAGKTLEEVRSRQADTLPVKQLKDRRVPAQVTALLKSMLAVYPAERPQTARDLISLLHRCYIRFEPRARTRRRRWLIGAGVASLLAVGIAIGRSAYQRARSAEQMDKSIAVLPFENRSPGDEDGFFAIGLQDEVAGELTHLSDIKVIGTQSTRAYLAGAPRDLPGIGRELSVRYLLEGNIRRSNGQLRIALHLVDLRRPDKTWDRAYERPMKDIFLLQAEIIRAIAAQLQTQVPVSETAALDLPPTDNLEAYDLYLRALALPRLVKDPAENIAVDRQKVALLEQAVARDPRFVFAYCELARAHSRLYREEGIVPPEDGSIDHRSLAEAAVANATRLAPDGGRVHLALANVFYTANSDPEQARVEVELARRSMPNNPDLEQLAATIARRQGRWEDAVRSYQRAVTLDPRQPDLRFTLAETYRLMRHYREFDGELAAVIAVLPKRECAAYRVFRAFAPYEERGEVVPLRIALSKVDDEDDPDGRIRDKYGMYLALADHDPDAVSRILAHATETAFISDGVRYPKSWYEALGARLRGDKTAARVAFAAARGEVERVTLANPADGKTLSFLAVIDAGLERNEQATAEAKRAVALVPFDKSSVNAPVVRCNLAAVYAWTGHPDLAIGEIADLVTKPAGANIPAQPTYGDLKLNPLWDPLRTHPRFPGLIAKFAPKI